MRSISKNAKRINNLHIASGFRGAVGGASMSSVVRELPGELGSRVEHFKTLAYLEGVSDRQREEQRKLDEARREYEASRSR